MWGVEWLFGKEPNMGGVYMKDRTILELKALLNGLHDGQALTHRRLERLMSKVSDFATAMNAFTDRQDTAVAALQGDVTWLKDKIDQLQNTPGEISAEDQALLDAIQARAGAVADKLDALDAMTPPPVPAA